MSCTCICSAFTTVVLVLDTSFFSRCQKEILHPWEKQVTWIIETNQGSISNLALTTVDITCW
ncbi:Uncharacterised protein [Mycobacterium tuberculosis]|nr:Uncharacterised protein [Mycobacterium tuberculosis]